MTKEIKKSLYILPLKYTKGIEFGKFLKVFLRKLKYAELALFYYNFHLKCIIENEYI